MFLLRICWMAIRGLQANLMRSLLATLGVLIGVAAVVSAISILDGANRDILKRFESMGADQLMIVPGGEQRSSRQTIRASLTPEDADAIAQDCELVVRTAPEVSFGVQVKYFSKNKPAQVLATTGSYARINDYKPADGTFITDEDVRAERKVCVLGHKLAQGLFGEAPAVGTRVKIDGTGFYVKGVMEKKGFLGFREVDSQVIVPLTTAMKRMVRTRNVSMITVQGQSREQLDACRREVKAVLRRQHNIRAGDDEDFTVYDQEQFKQTAADFTKIFAIVLGSIAGISLVVGGIGIMNIMLVSVTERTREIGVRIAVGATWWDIFQQFLIEAVVISALGGGLGVLVGLAFADLLEGWTQVLKTYTEASTIHTALIMAGLVGLVSGMYPAIRAARLDPVEALRYE